ncbi:MAG: PD40 domain-containing protein [Flavobacteriales bacterium]|nr:PD40 domain-containing protein [Flavobacteriales bacterium]
MAITAFGQTRQENKMRIRAVKAIQAGKFQEAQTIYYDLLKLDPNNPDYNYEMGLAIFEEGVQRGKAAPYFDKAISNTASDSLSELFLFAGKAEQFAGNFDIAIQHFQTYMKMMKEMEDISPDMLDEDVLRYIEMCENGKVQFENNMDYVRIENLGKMINSEYPDYSPVVSNDETVILFTSRRDNTTGEDMDSDDKYYEDIYYSLNVNGSWTPATNYDSTSRIMNSEINTDDHDAAITYAADETQLYIYREEDVWVSKLEDGVWTMPIRDEGRINSAKGFEPSVFITDDQRTMFVVSEIGTGYGGRDIYMTKKNADGSWRQLETLGRTVNTKFDEDAPFLTPDGNTLYFASNGHNSMGDYDIFKTVVQEDGTWGIPENLGPPINTPGHDRYFVTTDDGAIGYYSSDRDGGYGETDIYRIILDCKAVSATIIRGVVYSEDKASPIGATISIFDASSGKFINNYIADSSDGKYEMRLKTETTYKFRIAADGYLAHSGEFTVPKQCDYFSLFQEIKIDNMEDSLGRVYAQRAYINNAFFNIDQKMEEDFADMEMDGMEEEQKDSLRSIVATNYNPVELTNYIKLIDILDPNGTRIGGEILGEKSVATIQARDEIKSKFNNSVVKADQFYYNDNIPEARANYIVANVIDQGENYPKQQLALIKEKMADEEMDAFLATVEEVDQSDIIIKESIEIADNSSMIIPVDETVTEPVVVNEPAIEEVGEIAEQPAAEAVAVEPPKEEAVAVEQPAEEVAEQPVIAEEVTAPIIATTPEEVASIIPIETPVEETPLTPEEKQATPEVVEEIAAAVEEKAEEEPVTPEAIVTPEVTATPEVIETPEEIAPAEAPVTTPEKVAPTPEKEETIVFRNILFDFDRSFLRDESVRELNKVGSYMSNKTEVELRIDGHADWMGSEEYNLALSEKRAKTAYNYLLEQGIGDARLTYQFFGESVPIAPNTQADGNDNPDGRQLNRRCEFKLNSQGTAENVVMKF